jgi:hypothetical protein
MNAVKGNTMQTGTALILPLILGAVCALIVYTTLTGKPLLFITTPKAGLIALLVVGMAMCTGGIGQVAASGKWVSPMAFAGYLLGLAILVVFFAGLTGWKLPLVQNINQAVAAIAALMLVKFVIATLNFFIRSA